MNPTLGGDFEEYFKSKFNIEALRQKFQIAVSVQADDFIGDIQSKQMSGRQGDRYLNVRTGHLRRGWFGVTGYDGDNLQTVVFTDVPYAAIHQYGGVIHQQSRSSIVTFGGKRGRFVKPSESKTFTQHQRQQKVNIGQRTSHIPKRLYVVEEFQKQWGGRMKNALVNVLTDLGF